MPQNTKGFLTSDRTTERSSIIEISHIKDTEDMIDEEEEEKGLI